ncbi:hypothetical protein ACN2MM_12625 [Alkalilimnicola ehrlichii MLHE-1]|nr:hypothetical protein [Alkalilimnicola ehrlichii]
MAGCVEDEDFGGGLGGEPERIEIVSDQSIILSGAGDSAEIEAYVVLDNGRVDRTATIEYESTNPDLIGVDASGRITALTHTIGSANIQLSAEGVEPVMALAAIADLAPGALYVDAGWVVDDRLTDEDELTARVVLQRNEQTEGLAPGDVLVSGDRAGLLDRVTEVTVHGNRVVLETEPAELTDAFENLSIQAQGTPLNYGGVLDEDGHDDGRPEGAGVSGAAAEDRVSGAAVQQIQGGLECKLGGSVLNIGVTGLSINHNYALVPRVDLDISNRSLNRFDIYLDGQGHLNASLGGVTLSGGGSADVNCSRGLRSVPFAAVPVVGPVLLTPSLEPSVGFKVAGSYQAGELSLSGIELDQGASMELGIGYTGVQGFRGINEFETFGDGVDFANLGGGLENEFSASVGPYMGAALNLDVRVLRWELASTGLVGLEIGGGSDLSMTYPFDSEEQDYRGPRWSFFAEGKAGFGPLLDSIKAFERILDRMGVPGAANISGFVSTNVNLVDIHRSLLQSPNPQVQAAPAKVEVEEPLSLQVSAGQSIGSLDTDFVAFRTDQANDAPWTREVVAQASNDGNGNATETWVPATEEAGVYAMNVRVYDGLFGALGFPYAAENPANVEVSSDVILRIDPPGLSDGEVGVQYSFNLNAVRIPPDVDTVTFDWAFGDGNSGSTQVSVGADNTASTTISHAYGQEGAYGLVATLSGEDGQLADSSAVVTIGEVEERDEELDICNVWRAADQGGQGVTVDNWDISEIPTGAVFDLRFDAYSIPDKYIVEYPAGAVVHDTGWRGASRYEGDPLYPGGIAGPGRGQADAIFMKGAVDSFKITVIGPQSGTAWRYDIRCRVLDDGN